MLVARMLPCFRHFTHPWLKPAKDATAPPILSLLGAAEARAIDVLTSWLSRQVPLPSTHAAVPLSRNALAPHGSWGCTGTVSFSSVETLRRDSGLHATPAGTGLDSIS